MEETVGKNEKEFDEKIEQKTTTKNTLKTLQGSVTQEEKDAFFKKCQEQGISPSRKVKELCNAWTKQ